jgi:CDP-6-deoxy-D-xylo-4-hexulose-3-dehydrase
MKSSAASLPDLDWPLMDNNITREDLDVLIGYLRQPEPRLTQAAQVAEFEREWSAWTGVRHSLFVNSGSSANLLTLAAWKELYGPGEIIVPPLTWVSDITAVLYAGFRPVFADINKRTLAMDTEAVLRALTPRTKAVFLTHILGYNGLTRRLIDELASRGVPLIEDVCESHGAVFEGRRLGSWGKASNFSFYYAHHLSTIEGGMICTDDEELYQTVRMLRSHGMVREASSPDLRQSYASRFPDLNPSFIFAFPAYNVRSTELNAVLGRSGLKRLDENNRLRSRNLALFLEALDPDKFFTDFDCEGNSNYAFTLILKKPDDGFRDRVEKVLRDMRVEYRRGTSGGGNQLRQPYLKRLGIPWDPADFPNVEHVHFYGYYLGNYPTLDTGKIRLLCDALNHLE